MNWSRIEPEWEVFVAEGETGIGGVRDVTPLRMTVCIEGYGAVDILPGQVAAAHDGKVILDLDRLSPHLQDVIRHAHDLETED